jgi:superfamily I DNA and/or RNA helicase
MTPDEKKEQREVKRAVAAAKKAEWERKRNQDGTKKKKTCSKDGEEELAAALAEEEPVIAAQGDDDKKPQSQEKQQDRKKNQSEKRAEDVILFDATSVPVDSVKPPRKRGSDNMVIHPSPLPFDRHMTALTASGASEQLKNTLLVGRPSLNDRLRIIEGPPGTGKTTRLITDLSVFSTENPTSRILICSPTNVGICDLYTRAIKQGIIGYLYLSKSHTSPDVPPNRFVTLEQAKLVFCTLSSRSCPTLWNCSFSAVFVDEAAQCPEALTWGVIRPDVEFLYMAGDIKQLSSVVSKEGKSLKHDRSLMERLITLEVNTERLTVQRRMHPAILEFPNRKYYGNLLQSEATLHAPGAREPPYLLRHVDGAQKKTGTSFENAEEAKLAIAMATDLAKRHESVVIISPYQAQNKRLLSYKSGVPVHTVDGFQGKEADAVVLSIVKTSDEGFWSDPRRLNVALTRAKKVLRVVCNTNNQVGDIKELIEDARERKLIG